MDFTQWLSDMQEEENTASPLGEDNSKTWSDYQLKLARNWKKVDASR